ncbi:MAG: hypothetical protein AB7F32_09360 [Victivallaceae bacterium]
MPEELMIGLAAKILAAGWLATAAAAAAEVAGPLNWSAVDGLGRPLSSGTPGGVSRSKRTVAMFYWVWHYAHADQIPRNVNRIITEFPEARNDFKHRAWEKTPSGTPYFWNEPLFGYYTNLDPYIVRKHAELLADAGVDVIVLDCTNGTFTWMAAVEALIRGFEEARQDGVPTPQIAFMLNFAPNGNTAVQLRQLYRDIYRPGIGRELWFRWRDKPLILAYPAALNPKDPGDSEILDFFTFRRNQASYFTADSPPEATSWGWCSTYPQSRYGFTRGKTEEMAVSVAQNASKHGLVAMNDFRGGVFGRGYARGEYMVTVPVHGGTRTIRADSPDAVFFGLNFQQQWDRALRADPEVIFVTGWNEWIAGRHVNWMKSENAFPDQYNDEFSRDIEPSAGKLQDHYYYQLAANVRRFKGSPGAPVVQRANRTIDIADPLKGWSRVEPIFTDYRNDGPARDSAGWKNTHYRIPAQRHDIVSSQVAYDDLFVYFRVDCAQTIGTPGDNWMRLLLDTDPADQGPHWEGFEYIVNRIPPTAGKAFLERFSGHWRCEAPVPVDYALDGKTLVIKIPRAALGFGRSGAIPRFDFKWADDNCPDGDILDFYRRGDVAPGGRFRYVFAP